jgi:hypothetical protein
VEEEEIVEDVIWKVVLTVEEVYPEQVEDVIVAKK